MLSRRTREGAEVRSLHRPPCAHVAQSAGGAALKTRIVRVRIPPMAPRWRSPMAEAASLSLVPVSVQIGPPARVPFRSAGRNPADYEIERRASRGSTPRGPTILFGGNSTHDHCRGLPEHNDPLPWRGVESVDMSVTVMGQKLATPCLLLTYAARSVPRPRGVPLASGHRAIV